jgi:pimeloyl-ACP methyl ester carboxylesterase
MGVSRWARDTMGLRLGPDADPAQVQWWINLMSTSDADVCVKATTHVADADLRADLALIEAPALLLTSSISGLAGEEAAEVWSSVPRGQREIIECSGYHISAVLPDECARRVLRFLREHPVD